MASTRNVPSGDAGSLQLVDVLDHPSLDRGAQIETLESRLADGYLRIESALTRGEDVHGWEEFWISLLHTYEQLCDGMERAA